MRDAMRRVHAFIAQHGRIQALETVKNFGGVNPASLLEGMKFDIRHANHYSHCAVVTDSGWLGPLARLASAWPGSQARVFRIDEAEAARRRLTAA